MPNNGTQTGRLFGVNFFSGFQRLKHKTLLWYFCNFFFQKDSETFRNHFQTKKLLQLQGKLKLDTEITPVEKGTDTVPPLFLDSFHLHSSRKQAPNWKHAKSNVFIPWFSQKTLHFERVLNFFALLYFVFVLLSSHCNSLRVGFETSLLRCHGL